MKSRKHITLAWALALILIALWGMRQMDPPENRAGADVEERSDEAAGDLIPAARRSERSAATEPQMGELVIKAASLQQIEAWPIGGDASATHHHVVSISEGVGGASLPSGKYVLYVQDAETGLIEKMDNEGRGFGVEADSRLVIETALIDFEGKFRSGMERLKVRLEMMPEGGKHARVVPDEVLVKYNAGTSLRAIYESCTANQLTVRKRLPLSGVYRLEIDQKNSLKKVLRALENDAIVEYAEFNGIARANYRPNDFRFNSQWYLDDQYSFGVDIDAPEAWDITTGSDAVVVAIIDTGIELSNPEFTNTIWTNPYEIPDNGVDDDNNGYKDDVNGWYFNHLGPDSGNVAHGIVGDPHGTWVASVIGAEGDNEHAVAGVAWGARMMILKVSETGLLILASEVSEAIRYATHNGAHVINLSLGFEGDHDNIREAVKYAYKQGCALVAANGNLNRYAIEFPAGYAEVLAVGATAERHIPYRVSSGEWGGDQGSTYGASIALMAPGHNILVADVGALPGQARTIMVDGTSFAAPLVAGVAALILSHRPDLMDLDDPEYVYSILKNTAEDIVYTRGTEVAGQGWDRYTGFGLVNAYAALSKSTPFVQITNPVVETYIKTNVSRIVLSGKAQAVLGIDRVEWRNASANLLGNASIIRSPAGAVSWMANIPLTTGYNEITITAHDSSRNMGSDSVLVVSSEETLSDGAVGPEDGTTKDVFIFTVKYTDPTGKAPLRKYIYIDDSRYEMTLQKDQIAHDGVYEFKKKGLSVDLHDFRFEFLSANEVELRLPDAGTFSGPSVSSPAGEGGDIHVYVDFFAGSKNYPGKGGEIYPLIGDKAKYLSGDQIWFTAYPDPGWEVDYWEMRYNFETTGKWIPVDQISGNRALVIVREPIPTPAQGVAKGIGVRCFFKRSDPSVRSLSISKSGPGSVSPEPGIQSYAVGTHAMLTATPAAGGKFVRWLLDGVELSRETTMSILMDGALDKEVRAEFGWEASVRYVKDLPCIADATILPSRPSSSGNNGDETAIHVTHKVLSGGTVSIEEAILKYDVDQLPEDAIIEKVELHLWCYNVPPSTYGYEVQRNLEDWGEADEELNPTGLRSQIYWSDSFDPGDDDDKWHVIELSAFVPESKDWVTEWRAGQNYGVRLRPHQYRIDKNDYLEDDYDFRSREYADSSKHPFMRVTYLAGPEIPIVEAIPKEIRLVMEEGDEGPVVSFFLHNTGNAPAGFQLYTADQLFEFTSPTTGIITDTPHEVKISVFSGRPEGRYYGEVIIEVPDAYEPLLRVPVHLEVTGPNAGVSPEAITTGVRQGTVPESIDLDVWNSGAGTLLFEVLHNEPWLQVTPANGASTGEIVTLHVDFDSRMLPPGRYTDVITIIDGAREVPVRREIPVVLEIWSVVDTPQFASINGLTSLGPQGFTVSSATEGAVIRYTLDGNIPTEDSPLYEGQLLIAGEAGLIRAKAWKEGMLPSKEGIAAFEAEEPGPQLEIARIIDSIVLKWPTSAVDYVLEHTTNLSASNWAALNVATNISGDSFVMTNKMTNNWGFFRLRK